MHSIFLFVDLWLMKNAILGDRMSLRFMNYCASKMYANVLQKTLLMKQE